ncbi:MAG: hypothetical protein DI563_05470 [Variovorax paradoxus]|uniref:Uncharacterized protein n=1 Tax=Variovorax paradoxus TaxID=34073 RepID=A0A2W5QEN6_VARPD|nr:MAG: hypothetical protein DI563_05470 [Variovorax paradoxus]
MSASKLTRTHRMLARTDPAVAEHLRRRIREPARFDALMAARTRFTSDTPCAKCGGCTRTVYASACWTCAVRSRPLQRDIAGKVTGWPAALRSRAGWLAVREERRRERAGDVDGATFGLFTATTTPTGRLSLHAPAHGIAIPDMAALSFDHIHHLSRLYPEVLQALVWAGWT